MASERPQRKLAAILAADVVGYSRLAGADEDRILARLRALRSDLIDPTIAASPRFPLWFEDYFPDLRTESVSAVSIGFV